MRKKYKYYILAAVAISAFASTAFFWKNWDETLPFFANEKNPSSPTSHLPLPTSNVQNGIYRNERFAFSLSIPEGFKVTENNPDEFTTLVLVERSLPSDLSAEASAEEGALAKEGFQIFIMPFDEPGPITSERILIDEPDIVIKNPQTVQIAGEEALVFFSTDPDIGDVREVWFVHKDRLYQASTYAKYDELLAKVMKTFRFK